MKTLIALLLVTAGLGAAYWKLQHPDATVDDIKTGASNTLERAKSGFATFQNGGSAASAAELEQQAEAASKAKADSEAAQQAVQEQTERLAEQQNSLLDRLSAIESESGSVDGTVVNGRLTDAERRLDASDQKLTQISGSVDALAEELDTVSSSLGNLNDNVAASANQDQGMGQKLDTLTEQVNALSARISEQDAEQTLTNIGTRIDSIDSRLTELGQTSDESMNELNATMTVVNDKSAALESRINTLSVDAGGNDENGGNLRAQVDQRLQQIESKLATVNADALRVNNLAEKLQSADEQITSLSASQAESSNTSDRVQSLLKILDSNTKKTAVLEARLDEANTQITRLNEELTGLKSSGSNVSVEALQAELNKQLERLKNRIDNTNDNTNIATLNQSLATTRNRIQLLESRVQGLPSDGDTAEAAQIAQSGLQQQIAAMEERLRALPQQTDPQLLNTLNQVQAQVAELRDREASNGVEYKVYFGRGSTTISDEAAVVLKSFIRQEQNRTTGVNIYGFTDRRGDAAFNQRLALQRATEVRSFLIKNGFDFTKIKSLSGLGEDAAAATLADGAEDADQRTVVLVADQP